MKKEQLEQVLTKLEEIEDQDLQGIVLNREVRKLLDEPESVGEDYGSEANQLGRSLDP